MRNISPEALAKQTLAQKRWHKENYERISVDVPKGKRAIYNKIAKKRGVSLSSLISNYLDSLVEDGDGEEDR